MLLVHRTLHINKKSLLNLPFFLDSNHIMSSNKSKQQVTRRSTRSTRHARPLDHEYWQSLGYDETTSMNMANFTFYVDACQQNKEYSPPYEQDGELFVPFDEQLLPHWRVLSKSLHFDDEEEENSISLSNIQLPKVGTHHVVSSVLVLPKLKWYIDLYVIYYIYIYMNCIYILY